MYLTKNMWAMTQFLSLPPPPPTPAQASVTEALAQAEKRILPLNSVPSLMPGEGQATSTAHIPHSCKQAWPWGLERPPCSQCPSPLWTCNTQTQLAENPAVLRQLTNGGNSMVKNERWEDKRLPFPFSTQLIEQGIIPREWEEGREDRREEREEREEKREEKRAAVPAAALRALVIMQGCLGEKKVHGGTGGRMRLMLSKGTHFQQVAIRQI